VLLDDIVNTSLRSLALSSLLSLLLSFLLALTCGFTVGGAQTCTGSRALSLAWW
jgi:hypothetical protein